MKVKIKYEYNKISIIREVRDFLNKQDFFEKFVKKKVEEGYNIEFNNNIFLVLKKDNDIIRCLYLKV